MVKIQFLGTLKTCYALVRTGCVVTAAQDLSTFWN